VKYGTAADGSQKNALKSKGIAALESIADLKADKIIIDFIIINLKLSDL